MPMSDIVDLEEALSKTGPELFKELYRIYPVADPEDYFKMGQWRNEVMKADILLIESHRRECGAPDPPDLDDIKVPKLPEQAVGFTGFSAFGGGLKPAVTVTGLAPATAAGSSPVAGSAPVVEIRLIALFVAKWKLDPTASKQVLAKLTPVRRRYVIQQFKATKTGAEASTELEEYIAKCEEDGSWDTPAATATAATAAQGYVPTAGGMAAMAAAKASVVVPSVPGKVNPGAGAPGVRPVGAATIAPNPAMSGLKRPLTPGTGVNPAWQQNKRPVGPGVVRPPGGLIRPTIRPKAGGWPQF